jgi:hypothetical protein
VQEQGLSLSCRSIAELVCRCQTLNWSFLLECSLVHPGVHLVVGRILLCCMRDRCTDHGLLMWLALCCAVACCGVLWRAVQDQSLA